MNSEKIIAWAVMKGDECLSVRRFEPVASGEADGVEFVPLGRMAEQPAQQQEPFAYVFTGIKQNGEHHGPHLVWKPEYMDAMSASMGAVAVPLYTSPPASKPLTDEEIVKITADPCLYIRGGDYRIDIARAIEAKLREKNAPQQSKEDA